MFEKRKIRKESLRQAKILSGIILSVIDKEIYHDIGLVLSKNFYAELISTFNPTTHITVYERLEALVGIKGDRYFSSIVISDYLADGFNIVQGA